MLNNIWVLFVWMGYGIFYNEKTSLGIFYNEPTQQPKERFFSPLYLLYPCVSVSREAPSYIELKPYYPLWSIFTLFSCISPPKMRTPCYLAHFPFYNALLVWSQWWCFIHFVTWTSLLFKILDKVGPFEDSIETCTWHQIVLGRWFPPRCYRSHLFRPYLVSGPSRSNGLVLT